MSRWLYPLFGLILIISLWELTVWAFAIPKYLLPAPREILSTSLENAERLLQHTKFTTMTTLTGFGLAALISLPAAILIVYSPRLEQMIYPILVAAQTTPKVAVAPLLVVWMGFGAWPKILIALLVAFFPILIDAIIGFRAADRELLQLVRSMGATQWDMFAKVRVPHALPNIFGGMKVAITLALIGAVVGEFVGSNQGLGYLLLAAAGTLDTALVFAIIILLTMIGVGFFFVVEWVERLVMPWYETAPSGEELRSAIY